MPPRRWRCEAGDTAYAKERALRSSELDPDNVKPKLLYARAMLVERGTDKAIEYTARIIGDDPDPDPDARMELAIMYLMADRDDDALSQVNQVLLEQSGRHGCAAADGDHQFPPELSRCRLG